MQEKMMKRQHEQIIALEVGKGKNQEGHLKKSPAKSAQNHSSATKSNTKLDSSDKMAYLKDKYGKQPETSSSKNTNDKKYLEKIHELQDKCENL